MNENYKNKKLLKGKMIPQQWYSDKMPLSIQWFNEITFKRYNIYYPYLYKWAEFKDHKGEKVLEIGCGKLIQLSCKKYHYIY